MTLQVEAITVRDQLETAKEIFAQNGRREPVLVAARIASQGEYTLVDPGDTSHTRKLDNAIFGKDLLVAYRDLTRGLNIGYDESQLRILEAATRVDYGREYMEPFSLGDLSLLFVSARHRGTGLLILKWAVGPRGWSQDDELIEILREGGGGR